MVRSLVISVILLSVGAQVRGGVSISGDVFNGASKGGNGSVASVSLTFSPLGSACLRGDGWMDFTPVFTPEMEGLTIDESMLSGFTLNSDGTLRLSLDGESSAVGSVSITESNLSWGTIYAQASIHRCQGDQHERCCACGRRHGWGLDDHCSHEPGCAALTDFSAPCTCQPLFLRVNWNDDDGDGEEDRYADAPVDGEDDFECFRAIGDSHSCWCGCDEAEQVSVSGLTASSELRLWCGSSPANDGAAGFGVEAIGATSGIGTGSIQYDIYDSTNGLLRSISRRVTAANIAMRPDWDDDGEISDAEKWLMESEDRPERWQLRVRDTPYLLQLASECPSDVSLNLGRNCWYGVEPGFNSTTNSGPFSLEMNTLQSVYVDTSAGAGDVALAYTLGVSATETNLVDVLQVHVVDTTVEEKWIPAGMNSIVSYDYLDVDGDVYWDVWRETEDGGEYIDGGYGSYFTLQGLEAGDYHVEVHFDDICEGGSWGYTSIGDLHVVDVRLSRLYETANPANRIFNPTRKDDTTGNTNAEVEVVYDGTINIERYAVPRNYLYVVGDQDTGHFNVTAEFTTYGAGNCTNFYCAFYDDGGKISNSETNVDLNIGIVSMSIPASTHAATNILCELRGGFDLNGNGTLDGFEASAFAIYTNSHDCVKFATIKGITREMYEQCLSNVRGMVYYQLLGYEDSPPDSVARNARSLLSLFYEPMNENGLLEEMRPSFTTNKMFDAFSTDCSCFAEWLTHNSGACFGSNDTATIKHYGWDTTTFLSRFLSYRKPFALKTSSSFGTVYTGGKYRKMRVEVATSTGVRLKAFYDACVKSRAEELLCNAPYDSITNLPNAEGWYTLPCWGETNTVFSSLSPIWVPGITLEVGQNDGYHGWRALASEALFEDDAFKEYDAFGTVGRGRIINPRYRFIVKKTQHMLGLMPDTYDVVGVRFACTLTDLYDFNYEDGELPANAAAVQIGCGNGQVDGRGNKGRIYSHHIEIDAQYWDPFELYTIYEDY